MILLIVLFSPISFADGETYLFTNCGQTGRTGPTQTQVNNAYAGTNLENNVTINSQGIQEWTVPTSGTYRIEVNGAQGGKGGGNAGGLGAQMIGDFMLEQGQPLQIVVGQQGVNNSGFGSNDAGPGGGGSFVVNKSTGVPLIVAGGGGGGGSSSEGIDAVTSTTGTAGGTNGGQGGINGGGGGGATNGDAGDGTTPGGDGSSCSYGTGGGGFYSRGGYNCGGNEPHISGFSFVYGDCLGGLADGDRGGTEGGFGGGGGVGHRASGGGGYSGGGGDGGSTGGGGGGSYNDGANQDNTAGANSGHGFVNITLLYESGPSPPVPEIATALLMITGCIFLFGAIFIVKKKEMDGYH